MSPLGVTPGGQKRQLLTSVGSAEGVFVNKGIIKNVRQLTGDALKFEATIGVKVEIEQEGLDFLTEIYLTGKADLDKDSWGSAFTVRELLKISGLSGTLAADGTIPAAMLQGLIGKEVLFVSYVKGFNADKGKPTYGRWKIIRDARTVTAEEIAAEFLENFSKSGYPKDYSPEVYKDYQASRESNTDFPPAGAADSPPTL